MNLVKTNNRNNQLFPAILDELFRPDWLGGTINGNSISVPPVNIKETDTLFEVELAAPGKSKEEFNIELDNDVLTISSEVTTENNSDEGKFTRREFSHTSFRRSFTLPESVNAAEIEASYDNGILKIKLPKREESLPKPKRQISIA